MIDMTQYIAARSDQLNADDLLDGPRTIMITKVTASPDAAEQPVSIHYDGDAGKPFKPCKTVRRIMVGVWGKDASKYAGRSMTLYRDPAVAFGGMQVGGIRVSHMSHIDEEKTIALQVTRGRKAPITVLPLPTERQAAAPARDDAASRWANGYIAKLAELTTLDAVQQFANQKAVKLGELETVRPDLHGKVTAALAAREADLSQAAGTFDADDTDAFGLSPVPQEQTSAEQKAAELITLFNAAKTAAELETHIAEAEPHKAFMPDDLAVKLEIAADKARKRIEGAPAQGELVK